VRHSKLIEDLKAVGAGTIVAEDIAGSLEITRCVIDAFKPAPAAVSSAVPSIDQDTQPAAQTGAAKP
jgi:hypothetical protein